MMSAARLTCRGERGKARHGGAVVLGTKAVSRPLRSPVIIARPALKEFTGDPFHGEWNYNITP